MDIILRGCHSSLLICNLCKWVHIQGISIYYRVHNDTTLKHNVNIWSLLAADYWLIMWTHSSITSIEDNKPYIISNSKLNVIHSPLQGKSSSKHMLFAAYPAPNGKQTKLATSKWNDSKVPMHKPALQSWRHSHGSCRFPPELSRRWSAPSLLWAAWWRTRDEDVSPPALSPVYTTPAAEAWGETQSKW